MNRIHVLVASVIVGLSAIFGLAATTKTVGIGEAKPAAAEVSTRPIAARSRKLNRAESRSARLAPGSPASLPSLPQAPAPREAQLVAQAAPPSSPSSAPSFSDDDDDHEDDDHARRR